MTTRLALLLVALATTTPTLALAQTLTQTEADAQARTHFDSGHLYFDRGEYEDALREFQAAYDLSHRAALLYNLYLSYERLGRTGEAADSLQHYLGSDVVIATEDRSNLEARLENLRERAAAATAAATQEPAPPPAAPPPDDGLHTLGLAGVITLGVGAASLIGFAITGGLALAEDGRLAGTCGRNVGSFCTDSDVSTLRTLDLAADVMLGIGLVAAAAGAVMLILDLTSGHDHADTQTVHLVPLVSPTALGLVFGGAL